ncbi:DegV domain-containing protein [Caloramator mitchellensis]|uniref:DegV domain-containing protein n=1 Tax=Caloramator mitchellensis TaxID=908809 RepID=A0A0R3JVD0_CALMK|nr:DegV family protein [Caloramator mitchellensis]KRQ87496.1 DegV domain-containing protein [Caloramator mitchellensis]
MKKIKIIADSGCDFERDYAEELGIHIIPLTVSFGEEEYFDRVNITTEEFYSKLKAYKDMPKTSQINPARFIEEFKRFLDEGYHIIYISLSSGISGTYQSAVIAKEELESQDIDVIDSKGASVGYGLIVREAALLNKNGKTRDEIIERVNYMRERMEYIFAVGNLDMLKRGGRISGTKAVIGNLLNIKPIMQFEDGKIVPYDKVRGEKAIIKKMIETMKERGFEIDKQVIGLNYSRNYDFCMQIKEEIEKTFGVKEFIVSEIGPVIGSHVGEGTNAVFFMRK